MTKQDFVVAYVLARAASAGQCHGEARSSVQDALIAWDAIDALALMTPALPVVDRAKGKSSAGAA